MRKDCKVTEDGFLFGTEQNILIVWLLQWKLTADCKQIILGFIFLLRVIQICFWTTVTQNESGGEDGKFVKAQRILVQEVQNPEMWDTSHSVWTFSVWQQLIRSLLLFKPTCWTSYLQQNRIHKRKIDVESTESLLEDLKFIALKMVSPEEQNTQRGESFVAGIS